MRILQVNNYLSPVGGAEALCYETGQLLQQAGHEVEYFGCNTLPYFNEGFRYQALFPNENPLRGADSNRLKQALDSVQALGRSIANPQATRRFKTVLADFQPELVHFHNVHYHLSPALLEATHQAHIPTVITHHDTRLFCSSGHVEGQHHLLKGDKGLPSCQGGGLNCLKTRCKNGSLAETSFSLLHQGLNGVLPYFKRPQLHLFPSQAMLELFTRWSDLPRSRLRCLPNFTPVAKPFSASAEATSPTAQLSASLSAEQQKRAPRFLYVGRLAEEKGVDTLLHALHSLQSKGHTVGLEVIGSGPQAEALAHLAQQLSLHNVQFHGYLAPEQLPRYYQAALAVVVPSRWFEIFGLTQIEAFAHGTAVVGSRRGAIPEILEEGRCGLLFEPDQPADLAQQLERLLNNPELVTSLIQAGRQSLHRYHPDTYLKSLLSFYDEALRL